MALNRPNVQHEQTFEREFLPLADALLNFAWRFTNDRERAEDLVQETFLKAWRFVDRYEAGTNAKAWLFKICKNAFINDYRQKKTRPSNTTSFDDFMLFHGDEDAVEPRFLGLHEEIGGKLLGDEVTRAINALPDNFRTVVLLDLEDFTYEEIAAIADIPIGTVRSRLHRSRNVLANKLREYAGQHGYNVSDDEKTTTGSETVKN